MKVRYVNINTAVLTYGGEYEIVEIVQAAGHLIGYRITCDVKGTTFVRPSEIEIERTNSENLNTN